MFFWIVASVYIILYIEYNQCYKKASPYFPQLVTCGSYYCVFFLVLVEHQGLLGHLEGLLLKIGS